MSDSQSSLPQTMYVLTDSTATFNDEHATRSGPRLPLGVTLQAVDITALQGQIAVFLRQLDVVMAEAPNTVAGYDLAEFEVAASIVLEGRGSVNLALLANAEAGGQVSGTIRFVFKKPS
jgi:hypothetical protein